MSVRILLIGSNSFIARQWLSDSRLHITAVGRDRINEVNVSDSDILVNCAISPIYKSKPYEEAVDYDLKAARVAAAHGKRLLMLSTRKVYAQTPSALNENSSLGPVDYYGENKLRSEEQIGKLLGNQSVILRVSNIYGYEFGRRSFFGLAMTKLRTESEIRLDVSPFVIRDFLSARSLSEILDRVCERRLQGVYNVGSGIGLPLGRVAQWLIQGYEGGSIKIQPVEERDSFTMDVAKLTSAIEWSAQDFPFEEDIKALGNKLKDE